jgi:uncharacterized protein (TIGR02996 family)
MNEAAALLAAIRESPDEDTPRLAYADWLDEHGDPDRAEFIRVQCAVVRLPDDDPVFRRCERIAWAGGEMIDGGDGVRFSAVPENVYLPNHLDDVLPW